MTEQQFMNELEKRLVHLPTAERMEILLDIQEYFSEGRRDGKTDQEIAQSLGSPAQIVEDLLPVDLLKKSDVQRQTTNKFISIANDQFQHIDVRMYHGSLIVRPSPNQMTTVELSGAHEKLVLSAEVIGETLFIRLESARHWLIPFNFNVRAVALNLFVPQKLYQSFVMKSNNGRIDMMKIFAENLSVHTNNGRINLSEMMATSLTAKTGNGRLIVEELKADTIDVKTFNGKIEVQTIEAETLLVQSNNGRIDLKDIDGALTGKTGNGRITLQTMHLDQSIDLKTNNGLIQIDARKKPKNVTMRAKTNNGKVELIGERRASVVFGQGEHMIRLRSGNGRIIVKAEEG